MRPLYQFLMMTLSLNVDLTVKHANFLIKNGCHGSGNVEVLVNLN